MHVLYIHQHFSTRQGAAGTRSYEMARKLVAVGHSVTMICGSYGMAASGLTGAFRSNRREGMVDGIRVIEFDLAYSNRDGFTKRSVTFLRYALGAMRIALTSSYDLLFATTTPLTAALPGLVARWIRGKPFVFEVRDLWPELPKAMGAIRNPLVLWALAALEYAAYRSANRCIALAPGIATGIARTGVAPERIELIPNGCDLDVFQDASPIARPAGVSAANLMAIFAGTHGIANGLDAVLDAAAVLRDRGRNDISLVLVGDGKCKAALRERVERERLGCVFLLDPIPKERLAGLLAASDIGIQCLADVPAFYLGTSPNKFFDYIAAGLPVLNNYPGWVAAMIECEQCGFAVAPRDAEALADALERAADDRAGLREMGAQALNLAKRDFDRSLLADRWAGWVTGAKL